MTTRDRRADAISAIRAVAGVSASFAIAVGTTRLASLHEFGGYRAKFPNPSGAGAEATIVNTGGGVAGGDRVTLDIVVGPQAAVTVSTPSAERIYRSSLGSAPANVAVQLAVDAGARLLWAPQATLLFNGAELVRRFDVELADGAQLAMAEITLFGRRASGEVMTGGSLREDWRVRRCGTLIFADATRLSGAITTQMDRRVVAGGAGGTALVLAVGSGMADRLAAVRGAIAGLDRGGPDRAVLAGASAWADPLSKTEMLVVRCLGPSLEGLQDAVRRVLLALDTLPLPAAWKSPFSPLTPSAAAASGIEP
jgi:urease accessory protein